MHTKQAGLPHETAGPQSDFIEKRSSLADLAEKNKEDPKAVLAFVQMFNTPNQYLQHFRVDELLSHYRTWKYTYQSGDDKCWISVMESRSDEGQFKIWLLGENRVGSAAAFTELLARKGISIREQYGTSSVEEKFCIITSHVPKSAIVEKFGGRRGGVEAAVLGLEAYLRKGLKAFFCSGAQRLRSNRARRASGVEVSRWVNPKFFPSREGLGDSDADPSWLDVIDIRGADLPPNKSLLETWRLCLRFSPRRVQSSPPQPPSPRPEDGTGTSSSSETGRMPEAPRSHRSKVAAADVARDVTLADLTLFKALGDPTRYQIFRILLDANRPLSVSELEERSGKEFGTVSQCLTKLKMANVVDCHRTGKLRLYFIRIDWVRTRLNSLLQDSRNYNPADDV